jgi:rod shape determining protein RodA
LSREFVTGRVWWRLIRNLNWPFLLVVLSLLLYGLFVLFSATSLSDHAAFYWQLGYILAGLVLATLVANLDYHIWRKLAYPFYLLSGLLLVAVLFIGTEVFGSQRWINFGPIPIQPSELAKIAVVLVLARELTDKTMQRGPLIRFLRVLVLTIVPVLLVYEQPDLGTSIVLVFIFFWMSFFARIRPLYLLSSLGVLLASTPLLWQFLHEYQRDRILVLFNPQVEPLGIGYNLRQSLITIGSGGFWGKGYLQGTQKQLQFLPVRHTDFIFAVLAEELGFLGVAALLTLYAFFF